MFPSMEFKQIPLLFDRVDLGLMVMKEFYTLPKSPGLELHYQMVKCQKHLLVGSYPSAEVQSVYSPPPFNEAVFRF